MTVGDRLVGEEVAAGDRFPVGMRILAVDDDQTCLKVLESLLRKCQYHGSLPLFLSFFSFQFIQFDSAILMVNEFLVLECFPLLF